MWAGIHCSILIHRSPPWSLRLKPQLHSNGALNLRASAPASSSGGGHQTTDASGGATEAPSATSASAAEPPFAPEWRLLEANDWKKRALALRRFMQAVDRTVCRLRLTRRLAKMQDFLAQVSPHKEGASFIFKGQSLRRRHHSSPEGDRLVSHLVPRLSSPLKPSVPPGGRGPMPPPYPPYVPPPSHLSPQHPPQFPHRSGMTKSG